MRHFSKLILGAVLLFGAIRCGEEDFGVDEIPQLLGPVEGAGGSDRRSTPIVMKGGVPANNMAKTLTLLQRYLGLASQGDQITCGLNALAKTLEPTLFNGAPRTLVAAGGGSNRVEVTSDQRGYVTGFQLWICEGSTQLGYMGGSLLSGTSTLTFKYRSADLSFKDRLRIGGSLSRNGTWVSQTIDYVADGTAFKMLLKGEHRTFIIDYVAYDALNSEARVGTTDMTGTVYMTVAEAQPLNIDLAYPFFALKLGQGSERSSLTGTVSWDDNGADAATSNYSSIVATAPLPTAAQYDAAKTDIDFTGGEIWDCNPVGSQLNSADLLSNTTRFPATGRVRFISTVNKTFAEIVSQVCI